MPIADDILSDTPHKTGVYIFTDIKGRVLYVGKAKDLRRRLASYLQKGHLRGDKVQTMLSKAASVETILTETEKEALILECSLIKRHRPRYNVILRDDKNYLSLRIDPQEEFPSVTVVRHMRPDGALYFGPFSSAGAIRYTLRWLQKLFPMRRCRDSFFKSRTRPCLNYQMNRCLAPCAGLVSQTEYLRLVKQVVLFFRGQVRDLVRLLEEEMKAASDREQFETAALYRDRLLAINKSMERQSVVTPHFVDQDVIGVHREGDTAQVSILFIRNGSVIGHKSFRFARVENPDEELLSHFLRQFYAEEKHIPAEILVSSPVQDQTVIATWLAERALKPVRILAPQRGDKRRLLMLAVKNAQHSLTLVRPSPEDPHQLLSHLQRHLRLALYPERIEGLDISNIGGKLAVASLVAFVHGTPQPHLNRRYRIRLSDKPNDYAMMREVVSRRLVRAKTEDSWPNLLLLDGGKGQLNTVLTVLRDMDCGNRFDVAALAKSDGDGPDKVYLPGRKNPLLFDKHSPFLLLLQRIRDEAHRFAIQYHRKLRKKRLTRSLLDDIPGVGDVLKKRLLAHFGSIPNLMQAAPEEIAAVRGIGRPLADNIKSFLSARPR